MARRQGRNHPFLTSVVVMLAIVIPGFVRLNTLSKQSKDLAQCVDNWANGFQDRTTILAKSNATRSAALDKVVRSVSGQTSPKVFVDLRAYIIAPTPVTQQAALVKLLSDAQDGNKPFRDALFKYIQASDDYNRISDEHPIEALAQKLEC